jgi:hypothetical protein
MLPCPFPRELPLHSIRQTRRPPLSYRTAAGRRSYRRPGSRTSSPRRLSRIPSNGSGFHKRRHGREHFPLASHRGGSFLSLPSSIGRPRMTMDATRASRRQTGGPYTSHCREPVSPDTTPAPPIARPMRAYALRPGAEAAVKSAVRPSEALLPFCSFLLNLPDRQRVLPRSHSKGSTFLIARRPVLGGMLGRGLLYSNSKSAQPVNSISYQPREVKYTSDSADVHLHRLGPFLSMSLFEPPSDNRGAHHANLAFDVR